jgi:hypothetical protein
MPSRSWEVSDFVELLERRNPKSRLEVEQAAPRKRKRP